MEIIEKNIRRTKYVINYVLEKVQSLLPDKLFLKIQYKSLTGYRLNLETPQRFNEKVQWLKLYDREPYYTSCADKFEMKRIVSNLVGEEYVVPSLGVWDRFDDILFDSLPSKFVLKCTHDSGSAVIIRDKSAIDIKSLRKHFNEAQKTNYYKLGREWVYKDIKPRIIAEEYLDEMAAGNITDYKLMCFNGKVRCSFTCTNRNQPGGLKVTFYDRDWVKMPFERHYPSEECAESRPILYDKMVEIAELLTKNMRFCRVDFYQYKNRLLVGELTFYPGDGYEEFTPDEWDYTLGSWLVL